MTTFSGSFSTTDKDKTIRPQKDPVDEVIDILDQIGQDDFTVYTGDTGAQSVTSPQVTVQQTDKTPMSPEQQAQAFTNLYGGNKSLGLYTGDTGFQEDVDFDIYNALSPRPQDNISGFQQASAPSLTAMYYPQERGEGIAGVQNNFLGQDFFNIPTNRPIIPAGKASSMPPQNVIDQINPTGLGGILQGILGSVTGSSPAIYGQTDEYGQPLYDGDENFAVGRKFENPATAKRLGFLPVGKDAAGNIVYDVDPAIKASQARQEEFSRKDQEDRERAAMLAAQQQQPVDPCPEGYRMDPVSKVCVPTDDTTEPTDPVTRTYDTMTKPEPNYTAATNFNVPAINLPDILTGN